MRAVEPQGLNIRMGGNLPHGSRGIEGVRQDKVTIVIFRLSKGNG